MILDKIGLKSKDFCIICLGIGTKSSFQYLSLKNMNNSFMGTISSYGLVLMILALLQDMIRTEPNLEKMTADYFYYNIGKTLTHFFEVYGESF